MRLLATLICLLAPGLSSAPVVSVGGTTLEIPSPNGYTAVTPEMVALYELLKRFVVTSNQEFAVFIPDADVSISLRNEIPRLTRRFAVQTSKALVNTTVSNSDFVKIKDLIKSQGDDLRKKIETMAPGIAGKISEDVSRHLDMKLAFSISQVIPLAVHDETARTMAYSTFAKYNMNDSAKPDSYVTVSTVTLAHVKGKVLFLYCFGDEADLEWSRQVSKKWATSLVAANPSEFQASLKESLPSVLTRVDWDGVATKALGGALGAVLIGLLVGLSKWIIGRFRTTPSGSTQSKTP